MFSLNDPPADLRAWERFLELGMPTKKTESYRYVRLSSLYQKRYQLPHFSLPNLEQQTGSLVFVNGRYCESLSLVPEPLVALPLPKAVKVYGGFLNVRLKRQLHEEKDPFALLNRAYSQEGLFLYAPPKTVCETPLRIIHLFHELNDPIFLAPSFYLFAGKEAQLKFSFYQEIPPQILVDSYFDLALESGASVSFTTVSDGSVEGSHFVSLRATLKENSSLKTLSAANGGGISRENYSISLAGEGCQAALQGIWELDHSRQHHVNVFMEHQAPHCTSLQKFKGVLAGLSRSSFEGKIYVQPDAQKTEAYQTNNHLVLGSRASANSKPNLEIFADDVKASHGATVGKIDQEHLFYLKTRGVSEKMAKKLLVSGFSSEILSQIEDTFLKEKARFLFA